MERSYLFFLAPLLLARTMYPIFDENVDSTDFTFSQCGSFANWERTAMSVSWQKLLNSFIAAEWKAYTRSKDFVALVVRKSSPAQPSDAFRRHPDKQEDEKGWQEHGGKIISPFWFIGLKCPLLNLATVDWAALVPLYDRDGPGQLAAYQL
ncbi:hypothetical protein TNCV_2623401 [Trichonephila clavipes]|nr:hypothetical protein TNCV_2623401 [Trichonephila clavipes]